MRLMNVTSKEEQVSQIVINPRYVVWIANCSRGIVVKTTDGNATLVDMTFNDVVTEWHNAFGLDR